MNSSRPKGKRNERASRDLRLQELIQTYTHCSFFKQFLVLSVKKNTLMFESHKSSTVRAAILHPVIRVSDIMTKTGRCGKSGKYVMSQLCSLVFAGEE